MMSFKKGLSFWSNFPTVIVGLVFWLEESGESKYLVFLSPIFTLDVVIKKIRLLTRMKQQQAKPRAKPRRRQKPTKKRAGSDGVGLSDVCSPNSPLSEKRSKAHVCTCMTECNDNGADSWCYVDPDCANDNLNATCSGMLGSWRYCNPKRPNPAPRLLKLLNIRD